DAKTVSGRTLGQNLEGAKVFNADVILPRERALIPSGGLAVLRGNLAPDGAIVKPAAAEPRLLQHKGRAVVFEDYDDLQARLDDPRRRLQVMIDDGEMMKRKRAWKAPARRFERGYGALFSQHIRQANEGCDFDFLEGTAPTPEPEIH